ncbi:MAG: hypothetical protein R3F59_33075 [Myxococcota bacterium]
MAVVVAVRGNDVDRDFLLAERHALVRWALEGADRVAAVSHALARRVAAWTGRTARVTGNAVDPARFFPNPKAGRGCARLRTACKGRPCSAS